jgi:hypothetical protein
MFMDNDSFGFGSKPYMKEVPPTKEAIFSFRGQPELVETEYGEKYSFPITLHSHPSYPLLEALNKEGNPEPSDMEWQSKCSAAKQLYHGLEKHIMKHVDKLTKFDKQLEKHYNESKWQLTRFDTGAYFLTVVQ